MTRLRLVFSLFLVAQFGIGRVIFGIFIEQGQVMYSVTPYLDPIDQVDLLNQSA